MNQVILLNERPKGEPNDETFRFTEEEKPKPQDGEVLLKTKYVSVDPYLRGRMRDEKSYIEPFEVGKPISSLIIAEVETSKNDNFKEGDFVSGMLAWKQYQTSNGKNLQKVDADQAPLTAYLSILGMTGLTAYFGLLDIGKPKEDETVLVSGAAGAVGSAVGQIAKIKGCKVIGIAGSDEKIEMIKEKFGFDAGINYKTASNIQKAIAEKAPDGVDIYYDNVGGEILDAALANIARNGRIINCGAISLYNTTKTPTGPRVETTLIKKSVLMKGFTVGDYQERFSEGMQEMAKWLQADKLEFEETIIDGFDAIPKAFMGLFSGENKGKMLVKVF